MIGKYNPGHGVCYVSEEGKEVAVRDFQVLVAFHGNKLSAAVSAVKKALALVDKSTTERSGIFVTSPVSKLWAKKTSKKKNKLFVKPFQRIIRIIILFLCVLC